MSNSKRLQFSIISVFFLLISSPVFAQHKNPVTDVPEFIKQKYGEDLVSDEKMALQLADIYFKKNYINKNFDLMKPYEIRLIADRKVWEIIAIEQTFSNKKTPFCIRINKNTGEVLNLFCIR